MAKRRLGAQDAAKGILIIGVVFFHAFMMTFASPEESVSSFNILVALFPYLLSVFFFYSGYNYTPKDRTYKQNILRRGKQLLIPMAISFVASTVLISAMELAFDHSDVPGTFLNIGNTMVYALLSDPLALMIRFPQQGGLVFMLYVALCMLWFLLALFVCSLFFYALVKHTNRSFPVFASAIVALLIISFCLGQFVSPYLPYSLQAYPVILALMLTGAYLRKHRFLERPMESKKDIAFHIVNALIAEGLVVGVSVFCYFQYGATLVGALAGGQFDPVIRGFDAFASFGYGILGTFFLHTLCRFLVRIPYAGKAMQWVGLHSAIIYLFHPVLLDFVSIVFFQKRVLWGQAQAFVYVAIAMVLFVGVCLLIDFIVKKRKQKSGEEEPAPAPNEDA